MVTILQGDCREVLKTLEAKSVHACVTSPPYYGLRDYQVDGQIGLEQSPAKYVQNLVEVFREVRRVLRDDGTLWLNLGDSYNGSGKGRDANGNHQAGGKQGTNRGTIEGKLKKTFTDSGKSKDLLGIPWKIAFALQANGWWLRSDIIWHKPNPMPESVEDRPTKSHEYIFLLAKSEKYFYDGEEIREEAAYDGRKDTVMKGSDKYANGFMPNQSEHILHAHGHERWQWENGKAYRNKRSVWTIPTTPYTGAHFATYPPALIAPCIQAGTSEHGCCPKCSAPWERMVEKVISSSIECPKTQSSHEARGGIGKFCGTVGKSGGSRIDGHSKTIGWQQTCNCQDKLNKQAIKETEKIESGIILPPELMPIPCTVLDPFAGSGTTGEVCEKLGRNSILIELNPEYIELIKQRTGQMGLFAG